MIRMFNTGLKNDFTIESETKINLSHFNELAIDVFKFLIFFITQNLKNSTQSSKKHEKLLDELTPKEIKKINKKMKKYFFFYLK